MNNDPRLWGNLSSLWHLERTAWRRGFAWGWVAAASVAAALYLATM